MAVRLMDLRTIIDEGDAITAWTSTATLTANNTSPTPVESTNRLDIGVSNAIQNSYVTLTPAVNMSAGHIIYWWISHRAEFDTTANVGVGIQIGDGTNRVAYGIMGSDAIAFQHFDGPVVWQCLAFDVGNRAAYSSATIAGSAASLNTGSITQVGLYFKTVVKAVGGAVNCFIDIGRYFNPSLNQGCAVKVVSGSVTNPGTFEEMATADRQIGNQQAFGVIRKLGAGLYGVQAPLMFGNPTGSNSSYFADKNVSVAFEQRKFTNTKYKILIVDNGTGTTTFRLGTKVGTGASATGQDGCNLIVPIGVGASFEASQSNVTDVFIYGSTLTGFSRGIRLGQGQEVIGCVVNQCGTVFPGTGSGATMYNTSFSNTTATASLVWNTQSDVSGRLDGCSFTMGTTGSHAIQLGPKCPSTMSFNSITFTGYAGTPGTNLVSSSGPISASLYNASGKSIRINISEGSTPTVRNGPGATTTVVNSVAVTITGLKDNTEVRIFNTGTTTELAGTEEATDGTVDDRSFTFSLTAGTIVDIVVHNLNYQYYRVDGYEVPTTATELPVQQQLDRNYSNP